MVGQPRYGVYYCFGIDLQFMHIRIISIFILIIQFEIQFFYKLLQSQSVLGFSVLHDFSSLLAFFQNCTD